MIDDEVVAILSSSSLILVLVVLKCVIHFKIIIIIPIYILFKCLSVCL